MNWNMMLKMAVAALLYVLITAVLWHFCKGKKPFRTRLKVLIGLVFGACSVASNHIGIEYHDMLIMNVLDIGPLSAGLFFQPPEWHHRRHCRQHRTDSCGRTVESWAVYLIVEATNSRRTEKFGFRQMNGHWTLAFIEQN